ncbi:M55 family metallopeptidase [bacterium]|nr:M55 family metallopeptidase [bacterium]
MRVYIFTDLEGVGGVVLPRQVLQPGDAMYEEARLYLTREVNAAIEGALEAGANKILVLDGHGANNAYNLLLDELHEEAEVIVGSPWGRYVPCIEEGWDAIFCIGFHAMAGAEGVLEHTMSSSSWVNAYLNGKRIGELAFVAGYAGTYDIPIALVTGDDAVCKEAKQLLGDEVETVAVKKALSRTSARCLNPKKACELIKNSAKKALQNLSKMKPLKIPGPVVLRVEYLRTDMVQGYKGREGITVGERAIEVIGTTVAEAIERWLGNL